VRLIVGELDGFGFHGNISTKSQNARIVTIPPKVSTVFSEIFSKLSPLTKTATQIIYNNPLDNR
jgi:hypothetical protein